MPTDLTAETSSLDLRSDHETFVAVNGRVGHTVQVGELVMESSVAVVSENELDDPKGAWWKAYLRGFAPEPTVSLDRSIKYVDLFSGSGGLALGLRQACREMGVDPVCEMVADVDEEATVVHASNHGSRVKIARSVTSLLDFAVRNSHSGVVFPYPPELISDGLVSSLSAVDLVLAGPPCQGHSNLNNHTRRDDPRNRLYLTVPAFAVAVGAPICIIENVPAILNDSEDVVATATQLFEANGYEVTSGMLSASAMGWPQTRKRHFLIARRDAPPVSMDIVRNALAEKTPRDSWWAIADLEDANADSIMDVHTEVSPDNVERIAWLFDNDAYDLDLPVRPMSHRNGTSYQSVYGRMHPDLPAQTITTGFMSPGRGRYVHPTRRRVITAHEAARLQGFPDGYVFVPDPTNPPARSQLAKWIGDAVPMPLGYAASLSALGYGLPTVG